MKNPVKQIHILVICCSLFTVIPLCVDAESIYSGIDLGATHFSGDDSADTLIFQKGQRFSGNDFSCGLHVGYHITDWLAVEIGYMDFGSATQQFRLSPHVVLLVVPPDTQTIEAKGASLSAIASRDITPNFSLFGLLGVANMEYENTLSGGASNMTGRFFSTNTYADQGFIYGVGMKYKVTSALDLRTDLRRNDVRDFTLDSFTVGIEYSF